MQRHSATAAQRGREQGYQDLGELLKTTKSSSSHDIDQKAAQVLSIRIDPFHLSEENLYDGKRFFQSDRDVESFERAFDKVRSHLRSFNVWYPKQDMMHHISGSVHIERNLIQYILEPVNLGTDEASLMDAAGWELYDAWNDQGSLGLDSDGNDNDTRWRVHSYFEDSTHQYPHIACTLVRIGHNHPNIHRSELITILRMIRMAMRNERKRKPPHRRSLIYPAAVYSIVAGQARVLHAWYEDQTLNLRVSNFVEIAEDKLENVKLYLRWMMSKPVIENGQCVSDSQTSDSESCSDSSSTEE